MAKAYGALATAGAITDTVDVSALDLKTADGLRTLMAHAMARVAELPVDVRTATCLAQMATAQRGIVAGADLERRVAALEDSTSHDGRTA
jgi:hypothetical protein